MISAASLVEVSKDCDRGRTLRPGNDFGTLVIVADQSEHLVFARLATLVFYTPKVLITKICHLLAFLRYGVKNNYIVDLSTPRTPTQDCNFGVVEWGDCSIHA